MLDLLEGRKPLLLALGLALGSGVLVHGALSSRVEALREGWEPVPIIVAAGDVGEGVEIDFSMIARSEMPERFVSPSMVGPEHAETIVGQRLIVPLREGDPVLWSHFEAAQGTEKLSEKVMRRARAVTVSVTEKSSVGGWIRPNDHVDVLATFRDPGTEEMVTMTLLKDVIVLATGREAAPHALGAKGWGRGYADVSLLVLPEEAEILVLAQEMGSITLILRNPEEVDGDGVRGRATASTLLTGERTRTLEKIRHETIQVIRGNRSAAYP